MTAPQQSINSYPLDPQQTLGALLGLQKVPFISGRPFKQLHNIEQYVRGLGCKTILVEEIYIDRHYIEDYSIFYSKSLYPFSNHCRRVHFFTAENVEDALRDLAKVGREKGKAAFRAACKDFSESSYLGFCVIKPLSGSPVGRTVLKTPEREAEDGCYRYFQGTRTYKAHLMGVELEVRGLAFQQQDVGVSACATTALWASLQKIRKFEEIRPATPAQITMLGSQYALPFGRPMPSEGLSIDQMCQAAQSLGVPPNLFRETKYEATHGLLYSIIASGYAPVLVVNDGGTDSHAVAVVGMLVNPSKDTALTEDGVNDKSREMISVYVHDDRNGPYLEAGLNRNGDELELIIYVERGRDKKTERWNLTHILVPMHSKIRLSFASLADIALNIVKSIQSFREGVLENGGEKIEDPTITFETLIERATDYVEGLFMGENAITLDRVELFTRNVALARYLGVVRLTSPYFGCLDVLVDTTSTLRNTHFLGVVMRGEEAPFVSQVAGFIAGECRCGDPY